MNSFFVSLEGGSTPLEGPRLAFFGEGKGGFAGVFGKVELQGGGLHRHFALELVHIPAARAHVARTEHGGFLASAAARSRGSLSSHAAG